MKANKSKDQKGDTKKAAKKELEKSLTGKFLEAVKHLGHDAERVAKDIEIAGKFIAKKIAKKLKGTKVAVKDAVDVKSLKKGAKEAKKVVKKAVSQAKPVVQSVKVAAIATEEKAAKIISKPIKAAGAKAAPKTSAKPTPKTIVAEATLKTPANKTTSTPKRKPTAK